MLLTGGHVHDSIPAGGLIDGLKAELFLADKAYDAERLAAQIIAQGAVPVIPSISNRRIQRDYDKHIYKERHLIECFFCKIKEFRRIATRYEKLAANFMTMVAIASCLIWLR